MIKAQRQAARMLATRSRRVARPWYFPASSSRRGAPPALIQTKTRQIGESSEASGEFSRFVCTTEHFVHACAGVAGRALRAASVEMERMQGFKPLTLRLDQNPMNGAPAGRIPDALDFGLLSR